MNEKLIIINSNDRDSGTSANFTYSFKYESMPSVRKFRVNKITIPYSFYSQMRQTIQISYNAGPFTNIVFPEGNYTAQSMAVKLMSLINAIIPNPLNITYNSDTNKYNFVMSGADTLAINFTLGDTGKNGNYNLAYHLGLSLSTDIQNQPAFNTLISPYSVIMACSSNIYISSAALNLSNISLFNRIKANIIQSIPVNVNSFNFIIWENSQSSVFDLINNTVNIDQIDIQILDDNGNILDLHGLNVIIEIQFYLSGN